MARWKTCSAVSTTAIRLRVLDRLREDGSDLYPTYGDDSTWYDDTPTSGNLYLRVQNETTRLTWGDFTSAVEGPGLMRSSRDLYGVDLRHRSAGTTEDGEARLTASVHAAQPDSLPQRDILRGTGGSLYFLSRRELVGGSTRVTIEETDPDTGFVVATRTLAEGGRLPGRSPAGCPDPRRPSGQRHLGRNGDFGAVGRAGPEPRGSVRIPAGG